MLEFGSVIVAIMVMVMIVSTFGIPFTGYTGTFGYEKSVVLNTLGLVADLKKQRFELWLEERKAVVALFSESLNDSTSLNDLITLIQRDSPVGRPHNESWSQLTKEPTYERLMQSIERIIGSSRAYEKIQMANATTGMIVVSTGEKSLGHNLAGTPSFGNARKD